MRYVAGLDHVVVLVRDLADAEARLARLGFRPTPRGVHSAHMGTANTTVLFADGTYLEALGVLRPTGNNLAVRTVLAEREGPYGLALRPMMRTRRRPSSARLASARASRSSSHGRSNCRPARTRPHSGSPARTRSTRPEHGCSCASTARPR